MALLSITPGSSVTLDETAELQNGTATPTPTGDFNDNDILASSLPTAFSTRLTGLGVGTAINAALSGYTGAVGNTGSNAFTFSVAGYAGMRFTDLNGVALNGADSGFNTAGGADILLYTDTANDNIVIGKTAAGAIVFAGYLEETGTTGAKLWTVQYQAIQHPDGTNPDDAVNLLNKVYVSVDQQQQFSLANAPSGQNLFLMFTTAKPTVADGRITDVSIIATGKDPANQSAGVSITTGDTINTSQAGGPTTFGTNNQMITEQEGIRFTYVTGARQNVTIPNLDQNEADVESNIDFTGMFGTRTATFDVVQLQSGKSAQVKITALSTAVESGNGFIDGYAGDTPVTITNVRVIKTGTEPKQVIENSDGSVNSPTISITINSGFAIITGVLAGQTIEYTTSADHNRVLIENGAALTAKGDNHADFDIGGFNLLQASAYTAEVGSLMIFEDDGPSVSSNNGVQLDDDALLSGNAGGIGDDANATNTSGTLGHAFGTDAAGTVAFLDTGNPSGFTYEKSGNDLLVKQGTVTVLTLTVNATTGAYTVTQNAAISHTPGSDENNAAFTINYRVTDKDGDYVDGTLAVNVDDDTPTATGTAATGTVDEDGLTNGIPGGTGDVDGVATTATGSVAGIFQSGADTPLTYGLATDTSSLVALSSGGTPLVYSVSGNTLTAKAGSVDVFTFALTTAGAYTFTLLKPLDHAPGLNENDITIQLGALVQATDKDGDTVTAAAEKVVITVDDDTPTATGTAATGTVDEDGLTNGILGGTGDVDGAATTATGSVAGIFQSGADTPLTYGLSSVTTGLPALSSGGTALVYNVSSNTLTAKAGAGGADVFTFALTAAGDYTFTLLKPLDHAAGLDENDITINLGSLLQATDKDGDTVTAATEKLVITVDDDTPTATGTGATGTVDEDGLTNGIPGGTGDMDGVATTATGSVAGIFQSGADTPLTFGLSSITSGLPALSSGGTALVYNVSNNTLTAKAGVTDVFTFALTTAGAYTFTLLKPLDHAAGLDENDITINLGSLLQATDKDGDTVTAAPEKLVITVDDDTPTATGTAATGTVDEDGLTNGIPGGTGDVDGVATTATGSVAGIFQSGADTPLTYGLSTDTSGLAALSSGGTALVYSVSNNTLTAKAGSVDVFTFALTAAGDYTFTLLKPLDHPTQNGAAGDDTENDITIQLGALVQATDKDGDTVTAAAEKVVITVDDDTPTATGTAATGTVDEDGLTNGIEGGTDDVAGTATIATGSVAGIFQSGADTPLTYGLAIDTSGLASFSSGGTALVYNVSNNTLTAKAGAAGPDVFTFALTAAGDYTFTLLKPLDHAAGLNENDITINLGSIVQATDKDGDTVTAAAEKVVITVDDDTPTATGTAATGTVDEDGLINGIEGGTDDVAGTATTATGSVAGIFQSGADTPLTFGLSSVTSSLAALSSGGTALVYSVSNNTLTAKAGATDVFTFALTTAGAYTFTLLQPLDHAAGLNENDITINLGSIVQATDKDGDTVTAAAEKVVITVDDDTPNLAFGNLVGTGTTLVQYGFYSKGAGADGPNADDLQIALAGFKLGGVAQAAANFSLTEGSPSPDGSGNYKWTGSLRADFDNDGTVDATPLTFSLTAQPDGKYALKLDTPVQSETTTATEDGGLGAGGPDPVQTLFIPPQPAVPRETVVFFSAKIGTAANSYLESDIAAGVIPGLSDPTEATLEGPPIATFIDPRSMNVSTAGIGVDNNNLNGYGASGDAAIIDDPAGNLPSDDSFVVNPLTLVDKIRVFVDNSVTGYDYTAGERLQYRVFYANGDVSDYATVTTDLGKGTAPKFFEIDGAGQKIDAVQLTMLSGEIKIPNIEFVTVTQSLAKDIELDFTASLTDRDGDTATSSFSADIFANELDTAAFDYELLGASPGKDAFDVDLASTRNAYKITGFDTTVGARDQIVLLGDASAVVSSINNAGADSIVTVTESGMTPQTTTITVVGVDLQASDFVVV